MDAWDARALTVGTRVKWTLPGYERVGVVAQLYRRAVFVRWDGEQFDSGYLFDARGTGGVQYLERIDPAPPTEGA